MKKIQLSRFRVLVCAVLLSILSNSSKAHTQVVVIPLAGDDVPAERIPTTPIANIAISQDDYIIGLLTTIDNITKLEWQRTPDDLFVNWGNAWNYCANLSLDGHDDWRLPIINELLSIVDYGSTSASLIEQAAFNNTEPNFYWSASSDASDTADAWGIAFDSGGVSPGVKRINGYVRCVR